MFHVTYHPYDDGFAGSDLLFDTFQAVLIHGKNIDPMFLQLFCYRAGIYTITIRR
jgi:hypothetical protein